MLNFYIYVEVYGELRLLCAFKDYIDADAFCIKQAKTLVVVMKDAKGEVIKRYN